MKKFLAFALAVVALVATSCKPDDKKELKGISFKEQAVQVLQGQEYKLFVTLDPSDYVAPEGQAITFASSHPEIATVDKNGKVTGIALGTTTITATLEGKVAECSVQVIDMYDYINIADYGMFGQEIRYIEGSDTILEFSFGKARCQLGYVYLRAWDGDCNFVEGVGFVGDGYVLELGDLPVYWIMEGEYEGYYVGWGGFRVAQWADPNVPEPYTCQPGQIDPATYGKWVQYMYIDPESPHYDPSFEVDSLGQVEIWDKTKGAMIATNMSTSTGEVLYSQYGLYSGAVKEAMYLDAYTDSLDVDHDPSWIINIDWSRNENATTGEELLWGFAFDQDIYQADQDIIVKTPYANNFFVENRTIRSANWTTEHPEAGVKRIGNMGKFHKEMPIVRGQKMDPKTFHMAR